MQTATGPSNQGFVDLHNQTGFIAIMIGFVIVFVFIAVGAAFAKAIARQERAERDQLRNLQSAPEAAKSQPSGGDHME
jgi:hypothetical protein